MDVDLRSLIGKLDKTAHRALEAGAGLCLSRTNYNLELEHWLLKLAEDPSGDFSKIMARFEVNPDRVAASLTRALDRLKTGAARTAPAWAPEVVDLLQKGWLVASVDLGLAKARTGALLLVCVTDPQLSSQVRESAPDLMKIQAPELKQKFAEIVSGSTEDNEVYGEAAAGSGGGAPGAIGKGGKTPALDQFTVDLTGQARAGKIDPVLGRDAEIRQLIDILTRRRQNNPILTGEAGVGKTAVVEGFARRIVAGDVPPSLQNVALRSLDMGLLQAGAGMKGEFENRLKSVIDEVKNSVTPIIMFIDEAHTMIGAGGQAGQNDAANLLKPALARGELRTIAATTWAEYKKYFEKDAALTRRFQVVKVDEPTEDIAITMMQGLSEKLQSHHNVHILSPAIEASVKLSARYISGRQLPDKCVSLLDTACARVAISQSATPPVIEDTRRRLVQLDTEKRLLLAEQAAGADHNERIEKIDAELASDKEKLTSLEERWKKELELVTRLREIRQKLHTHFVGGDGKKDDGAKPADGKAAKPAPLTESQVEELRQELDAKQKALSLIQGSEPLLHVCVDQQTVAEVISAWTGIPVGRMVADEIQTILNLDQHLAARVVGQDHGLRAISRRIQTSRANMDDPKKPIGVFLLVGPSGVGKTETAVSLAETLYGGERNLISINMSEYQEAHTVSSLKGSPPGYVGYGEGGVLTEAVRRKPYSVVLLDEVEKAHPDVMELFFQVFDKGVLEDGEGREIDFKNTVILLTSNVATDTIMKLCADPDTMPDPAALSTAIRPELEKAFPMALLGRLVISAYFPIAPDVLRRIIRLKLDKITKRIQENHGIPLTYDDKVVELVASRCNEPASGARAVDNILTNTLLPELSREFLSRMATGSTTAAASVSVGPDGDFAYSFS